MNSFSMPRGVLTDGGLLAGRLLLAVIFLHEGWSILGNYAGAVAYVEKFGVPGYLLPLVIAFQLGAGALVATGTLTRPAALAFAAFCIATAVLFHWQLADRNQVLHLQKDLAIAGGFLVLACCGPGNWSLGRYLARIRPLSRLPAELS